ncbi:hypothetical protein HYH03_001170 [Edaphochlamys debaryana]|uniref:Protein kinase domain-containing protein n=1 Tax=Edaphochlamys debaryana TaxID=47281 RepID=A0A835YGK5_9CHLO|nr:hypothetical protein HYH03_001170 [Edaphochlamys debaryana]|eukprot:KAG2501382.1 hypothetical protein HYH03_001170 [Edaphochlamys debaryana]
MTDDFFDLLEGGPGVPQQPGLPRVLVDLAIDSGEGFGAPGLLSGGFDNSSRVLWSVLAALKASTGQVAVLLVQELAEAGTLRSAIAKGMFTPGENWGLRVARRALLRTAGEVARGMLHLHDAGLVHADLKPANVLLAASRLDRRGFTAKVSDFGLSHVIPPNETSIQTNRCVTQCAADAIAAIRCAQEPLPWPQDLEMAAGIVYIGRACMHPDPAQRPTMERVMQALVGIEQCMRADLLLGREAVQEILAGMQSGEQLPEAAQQAAAAVTPAATSAATAAAAATATALLPTPRGEPADGAQALLVGGSGAQQEQLGQRGRGRPVQQLMTEAELALTVTVTSRARPGIGAGPGAGPGMGSGPEMGASSGADADDAVRGVQNLCTSLLGTSLLDVRRWSLLEQEHGPGQASLGSSR